ncbi:MAG: amidohydrolase [Chloroflexi bacterium]|nr:amidohydrolase [Chloroflexota bacterium]
MVIDFHTHIFPPEVIARREAYRARDAWFGQLYAHPQARLATAEDLLAAMDGAGVARAVTCGFAWADAGLCRAANDYVLDAARRYPDRLIPFAVVQPRDSAEAEREIARAVAQGARGIGELMPDGQGYRLDDLALLQPLAEAASAHGLPLLTHTSEPLGHHYPGKGATTPDQVVRLAAAFPNLIIVCAHWGGGLPFYELLPEVAEVLQNVYYDTAASTYIYRSAIFPLAAQAAGAAKILWGSDYPLLNQRRFLAQVRASGLDDSALAAILGENARRLLRL